MPPTLTISKVFDGLAKKYNVEFPEEYRENITEKTQMTALETILEFRKGKKDWDDALESKLIPLIHEIKAEAPTLHMTEVLNLAYAKARGN